MVDLAKYKQLMFDVVGAIHEVHRELGPGLNEICYQEGLQMQLQEQGIDYQREKSFHPTYHGMPMASLFRVDFICKGSIIVECKAVTELISTHRAQLFNYMRLLKMPCGILVNFSTSYAPIERYLYDKDNFAILNMNGKVII